MYPQYSSNCSVISSVILNTWSRIARIFGGIITNVGDEPGSGDCEVFNCFCNELGAVSLACEVAACDQVSCDQLRILHQNRFQYVEIPPQTVSIIPPKLAEQRLVGLQSCGR